MGLFRGWFVQRDASNNGTSPKGGRLGLAGLLGKTTGGVVGTGVLVDGMGAVVGGSGAGMSYTVRACAIVAKHSDANGPTISALDATETISLADDGSSLAAPGSNSRRDVIYAVQDLVTADGGGGTSNAFRVAVRKGIAAASPATPSVADVPGAVPLAYATVSSGTTNTAGLVYTQLHAWRTANGGIAPTSKGSRLGKAWDGTREATVPLGLPVRGQTDAIQAAAFIQVGEQTKSTENAFGDIKLDLAQAFPTALLGVVTTDVIGLGGGAGAPYVAKWRPDFSTTSQVGLRVYQADTGAMVATSSVRISYIAWGY